MQFSIKPYLYTLLCLLSANAFADQPSYIDSSHYLFRTDYLSAKMPDSQDNFGLIGLHLDKQFLPGWYLGAGMYSAVAGEYSGFFGLGGELGWEHLLYHNIGMDTGVFVGTGGGSGLSHLIGNGTFVLPHLGLFYHFPKFNVGLNYSKIRFQTGQINSNQLQAFIEWPFQLYTHHDSYHSDESLSFDWSKNYLAVVGSVYHPHAAQFSDGTPLTNNTELVGIELGHFLNTHLYNYFQFTGAVHGNPNGYANIFAGLGWQQRISQSAFFYTGRLALGSGGGGNYDTGSGLLIYPSIGLGWQFAEHWQAEVLPGYLSAFSGHYHAVTGEVQLKHSFDIAVPGTQQHQALGDFDAQNWRVRLGNQLYVKPQHDNGEPNDNINLFALKIDRFFTQHWYATGQSGFAYTGNAAGYFSGLLGGGYQTSSYHNTSLFAEALAGTAGGAGLDIHDGAIGQLGAGLHYQWTPSLGSYAELSKTAAFKGSFNPTTVDVGLSYSFGVLS